MLDLRVSAVRRARFIWVLDCFASEGGAKSTSSSSDLKVHEKVLAIPHFALRIGW